MLVKYYIRYLSNFNFFCLKGAIFLVFFTIGSTGFAKTYYVAPSTAIPAGNDNNPGSKDKPWATWFKAFNSTSVHPGDTVFFRGGVYFKHLTDGSPYPISRDGTKTDPICYFAYPGEVPILDCSRTVPTGSLNVGLQGGSVRYCKFNGLKVRNVWSVVAGVECVGFRFYGSVGVVVENCTVYNVHGIGFHSDRGYDTFYINCDAYNCSDAMALPPQLPGNRGSGFSSTNNFTRDGSVFYKYCRAWNCADQGFVASSESYVEWEGCWAFKNGLLRGGGHGFKIGFVYADPIKLSRVVKNCISAYNRASGITTNDLGTSSQIMNIYNNTVYHNGFYTGWPDPTKGIYIFNTDDSDEAELKREFKNNISFANEDEMISVGANARYNHQNNNWDTQLTLTNADFISLDSTGISGPRQSDGSLPDLRGFLKLSSTSKAIDAGVNVGLPFNNNAPDLGAYESEVGANTTPAVVITSPSAGAVFETPGSILIIAVASDADGSISKVEFFNGNIRLAEVTSEPWSFTWKVVDAGTYSISAVAMDNRNAKTVSSPVEVKVDGIPITSPYDANPEMVNMYPNPNNGIFTIERINPEPGEQNKITIASSDGKIIYNGLMLQEELPKQFDLSYIKPGIYIMILSGNYNFSTKKFIKN